jgi:hypothetical protein
MTDLFHARRRSLLGSAALFAIALGAAAPAAAQDQAAPVDAADEASQDNSANPSAPPNAAGAESGEGDDIVVTGFRAALESAVNEKKQRDQIVESVSAEDIGCRMHRSPNRSRACRASPPSASPAAPT